MTPQYVINSIHLDEGIVVVDGGLNMPIVSYIDAYGEDWDELPDDPDDVCVVVAGPDPIGEYWTISVEPQEQVH